MCVSSLVISVSWVLTMLSCSRYEGGKKVLCVICDPIQQYQVLPVHHICVISKSQAGCCEGGWKYCLGPGLG